MKKNISVKNKFLCDWIRRIISIIFLIFFLLFSTFSFAQKQQIYWVSPTGNDTTGNGSQSNPWRHINYAIQQIGVNNNSPQRILNVMPGTYSSSTTGEVFPIEMVANLWLKGADSSNTILDAEQTELVVLCLRTKNVKITNLQITGGVAVSAFDPIGGISARDGAKLEVAYCLIHDCQGGIFSANNSLQYRDSITTVYAHHNLIKNMHSDGNGIKSTGGDLLVENNVFNNNNSGLASGSAIAHLGGAYRLPNITIRNNIILNGVSKGGAIFTGHSNALCEGNIIFNNLSTGFLSGGGGGIFTFPVDDDTCIIQDNIIVGNKSDVLGGGISARVDNTNPLNYCRIRRNVIAYNTAVGKGGAIGIHNGHNIIVNDNDIFANTGKDSINLFYHDGPLNEQLMNFQFNYLGNHPEKYHLYSEPDSLFDISNYFNSPVICDNIYNCDSLFIALGIITGIKNNPSVQVIENFKLYNNYPNPFNPDTFLKYELLKTVDVRLRIFNIIGEEVVELLNTKQVPGVYTIKWNGKNHQGKEVSSGIYFYHFIIGSHTRVGKMVLNR